MKKRIRAAFVGPGIYVHQPVFELVLCGIEFANLDEGSSLDVSIGWKCSPWSVPSLFPSWSAEERYGGIERGHRLSWLGWGIEVEVTDAA